MDEAYQIIVITLTAVFGIAVLKTLTTLWHVPGLSDLVAMV